MKKIIQVLILLCVSGYFMVAHAQIKYSLILGPNLSTFEQKGGNENFQPYKTKFKLGYQVGLLADYELNTNLSIRSGAYFISKGSAFDVEGNNNIKLNYLEVPINLVYKIIRVQIFGGPYLALGLGGKAKYDYTLTVDGLNVEFEGENKYKPVFGKAECSATTSYFKAFDFGIKGGIGYELKSFVISIAYSLGLRNLQPELKGGGDCLTLDPDISLPPGSVVELPELSKKHRLISLNLSYKLTK